MNDDGVLGWAAFDLVDPGHGRGVECVGREAVHRFCGQRNELSLLQQARSPAVGEHDLQARDIGTLPGLIEPPKQSFNP